MVSLMFLNSRAIGEVELMRTIFRNNRCKLGNYYILVTIQSSHLAQQGFINLNSSSNLVNLPCFKYHQQEQCKKTLFLWIQIGNSTYPIYISFCNKPIISIPSLTNKDFTECKKCLCFSWLTWLAPCCSWVLKKPAKGDRGAWQVHPWEYQTAGCW